MNTLTKPSPTDLAEAVLASAKAEQTKRNDVAGLADKADAAADCVRAIEGSPLSAALHMIDAAEEAVRDLAGSLRAKAVES